MLYYTKTVQETLEEFEATKRGLAVSQAEERLQLHGYNTIKFSGEPWWKTLIEPFANVFMLVLSVAVIISVLHHAFLDAAIISAIMVISAVIYYVQRFSTERILRSLQRHDAQSVQTLRDNRVVALDVSRLVPGDVIILQEGDKVPADARLIAADSLRVDETQLTGESTPISKQIDALMDGKEIYEQSNMLFQGSFIISGEARALVVATGNTTEFGQLAALTQSESTKSPVQQKIDMLLTRIIGVVGAVGLIVFGLSLLRGMELTEALRFVIAVSVSAVPESLPVAISVILVLGMRRMAARKALVRNMNAIETIGVITTIATDKTGTLTKNKLTVQSTWQPSITKTDFLHLITKAANHSRGKLHDPLDIALLDFSTKEKIASPAHPPLKSFPFDLSTAMSGNLWHHGSSYELVVKGAPEHVINRSDMTENEREEANATLHRMTGDGYRVIAVAHCSLPRKLDNLHELGRADSLVFDGFVAVADILRPEAKRAVTAALDAGVSVRMITGDHFETAYHIGKQLGMVTHREEVFDSRKLSVMSDRELTKIIPSIKVFSRVIPEHKYRILAILKKKHITAMTGDGVNDVPALANAHVGIAMGGGAQIAKDAGDIILMDNNFKGIVDAMHEGRTIFANIRRMLFYLLATNTGEVLVMIGALVIGLPVPLIPVQILWINLVTDTSMVIPLGLEKGEKSNMKQKPLPPTTPILGKFMISRMLLLAVTMASLTLGLYAYYSGRYGHDYGSTVAFCSLVVMQWASALCARSDDEPLIQRLRIMNGPFYIGLAAAVTLQVLAVFGPLGHLLHISPVAIGDLYITGLIAFFVPLTLMELHKWWGRQRTAVRRHATSGLAKPSADMLY